MLELLEAAVSAVRTEGAIPVVAFEEHVAILAVFITAGLFDTHTFGQLQGLVCAPYTGGISDEDVYSHISIPWVLTKEEGLRVAYFCWSSSIRSAWAVPREGARKHQKAG